MYIKLVNPVNGSVHLFQIGPEFCTKFLKAMTTADLDRMQEEMGKPVTADGKVIPTDNRRFSCWASDDPDMKYDYVMIDVPCMNWHEGNQLVIFTNWNVFAMSDTGQTIDRLFTNTQVGP